MDSNLHSSEQMPPFLHRNGVVTSPSSSVSSPSTSASSNSPSLLTLPRHVAFICDGNARWAKERGLSTASGHKTGADRCLDLIEELQYNYTTVEYCTFFGFSTENWKRPPHEVHEILQVLEQTARQLLSRKSFNQQPTIPNHQFPPNDTITTPPAATTAPRAIQLRILGDLTDERLPWGLRQVLVRLEQQTRHTASSSPSFPMKKPPLTVYLALNYGGRQDILQASIQMAQAIAEGKLHTNDITEEMFTSLLWTSQLPDPDLMIRTSGESRISNFLLWNAAYAELYFTKTLWPDFDAHQLNMAMEWYSQRCRRFGARSTPPTSLS